MPDRAFDVQQMDKAAFLKLFPDFEARIASPDERHDRYDVPANSVRIFGGQILVCDELVFQSGGTLQLDALYSNSSVPYVGITTRRLVIQDAAHPGVIRDHERGIANDALPPLVATSGSDGAAGASFDSNTERGSGRAGGNGGDGTNGASSNAPPQQPQLIIYISGEVVSDDPTPALAIEVAGDRGWVGGNGGRGGDGGNGERGSTASSSLFDCKRGPGRGGNGGAGGRGGDAGEGSHGGRGSDVYLVAFGAAMRALDGFVVHNRGGVPGAPGEAGAGGNGGGAGREGPTPGLCHGAGRNGSPGPRGASGYRPTVALNNGEDGTIHQVPYTR